MSSYLQTRALTKRYGSFAALDAVSMSIERGSLVAILGPNGAGKSTLFGCLLGFIRPSAGDILFNGAAPTGLDRAEFGYVAERVSFYSNRTVLENASFFSRLKGRTTTEAADQIRRVGLARASGMKVRQLSKGMLQRLGLAVALTGQPELLVLDEPFNGLDPALLDVLHAILREEHERGATLLISTHTLTAIEPLATHVAILLNGRLALFQTNESLRSEHGANESLETIYQRVARQHHREVFA